MNIRNVCRKVTCREGLSRTRGILCLDLLIATIIVSCNGCIGMAAPKKSDADIFFGSTGLKLPAGIECVASKTITVALVGDTHYLKLVAQNDVTDFINTQFDRSAREKGERLLIPPKNWMKDLQFWDEKAIASADIYFTKIYKSADGITILTEGVYVKKSNTMYVVSTECRD
jgi:hypothetical protein